MINVSQVLLLDTEKLLLRSNSLRSNKRKLFSPLILERHNHNSLMAGCSGISNQRETSQTWNSKGSYHEKAENHYWTLIFWAHYHRYHWLLFFSSPQHSLHCEAFFHPLNQTRDHGTLRLQANPPYFYRQSWSASDAPWLAAFLRWLTWEPWMIPRRCLQFGSKCYSRANSTRTAFYFP